MNKAEIYLELEAIIKDCRDLRVYFELSDLSKKIKNDLEKEDT